MLENRLDEIGAMELLVVLLVLSEDLAFLSGVPAPRSLIFRVGGVGIYPLDLDSSVEPDCSFPPCRCICCCCLHHGCLY